MEIYPREMGIITTQKYKANTILITQIPNYHNGCRYTFLDNRYATTKLLAIITYYWNRAVLTCKAYIIRFDSEALNIANKVERLSFISLKDKQLYMVIGIFLYTGSTVIKLGCQGVHRRNGRNVLHVRCSNRIVEYEKNIYGVDRCDQQITVEVGFTNVAQFKRCYKKYFL